MNSHAAIFLFLFFFIPIQKGNNGEGTLVTQMRTRILDVSSGGYTEEEMTEDGVLYDTETMMTLTARSPDFSNCVSVCVVGPLLVCVQ